MNFSILEEAVLYAALEKYSMFLKNCLKNPENGDQLTFIKGDLEITLRLQQKLKEDYLARGGPSSRL